MLLFFHLGLKWLRNEQFLVFLQTNIIDDFNVRKDDNDSFHHHPLIV